MPPFLTGQLQSVCVSFPDNLSAAAAEEDAAAEVVKVVDTVTVALEDPDLVVKPFAGAIGSAVLPAVLDAGAVVPDCVGASFRSLQRRPTRLIKDMAYKIFGEMKY